MPTDVLVDLDRSIDRGLGLVASVGHSQSELGLAVGLSSACHVADLRLVRGIDTREFVCSWFAHRSDSLSDRSSLIRSDQSTSECSAPSLGVAASRFGFGIVDLPEVRG